ncbi:SpsE Sialic acid synthase [Methylophilaceae bacterium]
MFTINNRKIGLDFEPYIIAELSANHNGSIERAKASIKAAKDSGAHAIKFQTYTADTMTINCDKADFIIKGGLWNGYKLYDLYVEAHTPFSWHKELFLYAKEIGITCFSTPFDETAVDLLEELEVPAYKIASFELTDIPLIKYVAKTKKPLLMSTGMASEKEIEEAVTAAITAGCESLLLFHCISSYPTPIDQSNLNQIINLRNKFGVEVGLSDHTLGTTAAITSIALGASVIEKHFTLDKGEKGPDSDFSIEPHDLIFLVKNTREAWLALGKKEFIRPNGEFSSLAFRRSIYFVRNLKAGHKLTSEDIRRIRPGFGLPPKYYDKIIGRKIKRDVNFGDPVTFNDIDSF